MKVISGSMLAIIFSLLLTACNGKRTSTKSDSQNLTDTTTIPDTGYTGIKQYMSGRTLVKEVTFKNGIREGLMKSFYQDGRLRQTFWYKNGIREDSAKWYYQEGQVFRSTPYKHDTIDGTQIQYYRNGRIKAKLGYIKGFRTPYLEEFNTAGKLVGGYPDMNVTVNDEYKTKGVYRISLELTDKSTKVKYFKGDFTNGIFDTVHCKKINTIKGVGHLDLKKTGSPTSGSVGVIAQILTNFGNNHLIYKKIELPYNDLK
jgi:hypothetical protein